MTAVDSVLGCVRSRTFRRVGAVVLVFSLTAGLMLAIFHFTPEHDLHRLSKNIGEVVGIRPGEKARIPTCKSISYAGSAGIWRDAQEKYANLRDDKFTIAMQTYQRDKELAETLHNLLEKNIPSLLEVVIVWNDLEAAPPQDYTSEHGVPVRYRRSKHNSLNEKLWPDPAYQTQAILLSDDDVYYHPDDLEFVFQTWRKFGRHRMTGALARCATPLPDGTWEYNFCSHDANEDVYSMILTNLAFAHISIMDYYSSEDLAAKRVRQYVDEHFNCEDIALNYVTALLTGDGPLLVKGRDNYVNMEPKVGISTKPHHLEARSACLYDLAEIFSCMPLVNETAHIERGVIIL